MDIAGICRFCRRDMDHDAGHRNCFFRGIDRGLWDSEDEWVEDCRKTFLITRTLSLPEDVEALVDRLRTDPVVGAWEDSDPRNPLCFQIREQIRAGITTAPHIANALSIPFDEVCAAVREMFKIGVVLL